MDTLQALKNAIETPQAQHSTTFNMPPLVDPRHLTIPELADWHAECSPEHPYMTIAPFEDQGAIDMTNFEFGRAVHRAARWLELGLGEFEVGAVVGIISPVTAIEYYAMVVGAMRIGLVPALISHVMSTPGAIHTLLQKYGCHHVLYTPSALMATTLSELQKASYSCRAVQLPPLETLYPQLGQEISSSTYGVRSTRCYRQRTQFTPHIALERPYDPDAVALYAHSSGSTTGMPKPIPFTHRMLLHFSTNHWYGTKDHCGTRCLQFGLSPCHALMVCTRQGLSSRLQTFFCLTAPRLSGSIPVVPHPRAPPATPESALEAIKRMSIDWIIAVPAFLLAWSRDPEAIKIIASRTPDVATGGARLSDEADAALRGGGINLHMIGSIKWPFARSSGEHWSYFGFQPLYNPSLELHHVNEESEEVRELVIGANAIYKPALSTPERDGAYETGDLFVKHPTKDLYRWYARKDDMSASVRYLCLTVAVSTAAGLNVDPGPIEQRLASTAGVDHCVVFGSAQPSRGALVEPVDGANTATVLKALRATLDDLNASVPSYCAIQPGMVVLASPKSLPLTPKRTVLRGVSLHRYRAQIDAAYANAGTTRGV